MEVINFFMFTSRRIYCHSKLMELHSLTTTRYNAIAKCVNYKWGILPSNNVNEPPHAIFKK